jgi:hypothetical protein
MVLPDRKGATAISLSCLKYFARTRTQYAQQPASACVPRALAITFAHSPSEVDAQELRIMGSKSELLRTLVAASSAKPTQGVPLKYIQRGPIIKRLHVVLIGLRRMNAVRIFGDVADVGVLPVNRVYRPIN